MPTADERIQEIRDEISKLAAELRQLVQPTQEEIKELVEDLNLNPEVYTSYLEDDDLFISETVYDERVAERENAPEDEHGNGDASDNQKST